MFQLKWTEEADAKYRELKSAAERASINRKRAGKTKSSKQEGLYKQVTKTIHLLSQNPRHPGLNTHEYSSLENPFNKNEKVFEAYAQNKTPGGYRVFWCYGPQQGQLTIIAITPHP